ncbi:hypothetical protein [Planomonospora sp. ID82291]|uniref:hypothetical protein n=1 Tax=Planomonospora sp. ID82291 TaxID=2738136 RepID=UPI001A2B6D7C|nr:hypothetical protein [Planomonospora sp. ID82291]MBG0814725.1 hypothetical protein [Planomonospora sp. ID82291]
MSTDLTATPHAGAELHRYADALLASLSTDAPPAPPPRELTDAPDHWLPPAVEALAALVQGDDALGPLGRAAQCDERRTALFLCLALAAAGQGDRIHASWFGTAFGDLSMDRPVTPGQRALWLAAAQGAYGPAGKIFVLRKLDAVSLSADSDPARWLRALAPDEPSIVVPPSLADFPEIAQLPELARPVHAAIQLARLRGRCVEITSVREDRGGPGGTTRRPPSSVSEDEPSAVLRRLIVSGETEDRARSLTDYLLADLRPGSDSRLAAIALHVAAPIVRSAAEELVEATRAVPPSAVTVSLLGHDVALRPEGPDPASLAAAEKHLVAESVPARGLPWPAYALFALGAVLLAAAFLIPTPLPAAALALLLSAGGAYLLWQRRAREQEDADHVAARLGELHELADGAVWALHEYAREAEKRAQTAASDLAELTRLLRRGPRAG